MPLHGSLARHRLSSSHRLLAVDLLEFESCAFERGGGRRPLRNRRFGLPFEFSIAMGVRKGETAFRDRIQAVLDRQRDAIRDVLVEYGVLGAIAGTVGAIGAVVLSWAVARFALDLPWEPSPTLTVGGIIATAIFVATVGVLASLDVLRHKPLATLRAE